MAGLPDDEKKFKDMYNRLDRIPACERQTDGQMDILPRRSPRYAYASRGKNDRQQSDINEVEWSVSSTADVDVADDNPCHLTKKPKNSCLEFEVGYGRNTLTFRGPTQTPL